MEMLDQLQPWITQRQAHDGAIKLSTNLPVPVGADRGECSSDTIRESPEELVQVSTLTTIKGKRHDRTI
jgi:hypothetical protein